MAKFALHIKTAVVKFKISSFDFQIYFAKQSKMLEKNGVRY